MTDIVLISCVKSKRDTSCAAKDMYVSSLFKKMMAYAIRQKPSGIFILSAKYGLLAPDTVIAPYEQTLNKISTAARKTWAEQVVSDLRKHADLDKDHFIFLAGQRYREGLLPHTQNYFIPMDGLAFGKQLQWLEAEAHV